MSGRFPYKQVKIERNDVVNRLIEPLTTMIIVERLPSFVIVSMIWSIFILFCSLPRVSDRPGVSTSRYCFSVMRSVNIY